MTKHIHLIYSSILFFLIVFVCIEYHNNNALESRINSLNKNSIDFKSEKTFKEDFYITQQNRDTTFLLVVFPIIVGVISLLTYVNITERHRNMIESIKAQSHKQKSENDSYHNDLLLLESELNFQIGLIYSDRASVLIENEFKVGLMMFFCSLEKFALIALNNNSQSKKEEAIKELIRILNYLDKKIDNNDFFNIELNFRTYKDRIENISKVLNQNSLELFNRITSRIKIIENVSK